MMTSKYFAGSTTLIDVPAFKILRCHSLALRNVGEIIKAKDFVGLIVSLFRQHHC